MSPAAELQRDSAHPPEGQTRERLRLWLRLLRVTRRIEAEIREKLRVEFDTTLPRFDVMAALHRDADGLMMSQLSRKLKVSNGNVTGIVERLVAEGLVLRTIPDGDRRASIVRLTEKGRAEFERLAAVHNGWVDAMLADFSAEEAATVIHLLDRLIVKDRT